MSIDINDLDLLRDELVRKISVSGHFVLASGMHASEHLDFERIDSYEIDKYALPLSQLMPSDLENVGWVIGVPNGAKMLALSVTRILNRKDSNILCLPASKGFDGQMSMHEKALEAMRATPFRTVIIEDVTTRATSSGRLIEYLNSMGIEVAIVLTLVNRGNVNKVHGVPILTLLHIPLASFAPEDCPLCKLGIPLTN